MVNEGEISLSQSAEYDQLNSEFERGIEEFFSEFLRQSASGAWEIGDYRHPLAAEFTAEELETILSMLNSPMFVKVGADSSLARFSSRPSMEINAVVKNWFTYTECIISGVTGLPVPPSLTYKVISSVRNGDWHGAASAMVRGYAEMLASHYLDYATKLAIKQLANSVPGVFVGRLVLHSSLCLMYNQ